MIQKQTETRKVYLDLLRIIAIIWVIFNHTGTNGYKLFTISRDCAMFGFYLFCSVLCKTAVPIFLMISGALLLKKDEPLSVLLKKRFLRMLVVLFVASFVMYHYYNGWDFQSFSMGSFLKKVYTSNIATAHWYLYSYLGYLLTLPFLRKMSKGMVAKDYFYLTCLIAIPSILRSFEMLFLNYEAHYNGDFSLFTTATFIYYPLMGDFLANKITDENVTGKKTLLAGALGLISIIVSCWLTCVWCERFGQWDDKCETFMDRFLFLPAIAVFVAARFLFIKVSFSSAVCKCIGYLGSCTFGVFLFEKIFRQETMVIYKVLYNHFPKFIACAVWVFSAFLMGVLCTSVAKKIPVLKRFL